MSTADGISSMIDDYYRWLKDNTFLHTDRVSGWTQITTPFVGVFNDNIEIYVKQKDSSIVLSDVGNTLAALEDIGVNFTRSKERRRLLERILFNYGISCQGRELSTDCPREKFAQTKHLFLEALIKINDMFILSKENVTNVFADDVEEYLNELNIVFTKGVHFAGSVKIDFPFDFFIAKRTEEILIRAINTLNKTTLASFIYAGEEVKKARQRVSGKDVKIISVVNNSPKNEYIEAITQRDLEVIPFSQRHEESVINKLAV